jgi:hypothetical protein
MATVQQLRTFALTRSPRFTVLHSIPKYYREENVVRRLLWLRTDDAYTYDDLEVQLLSGALPSDGYNPSIDEVKFFPSKYYSERSYIRLVVVSEVF